MAIPFPNNMAITFPDSRVFGLLGSTLATEVSHKEVSSCSSDLS